MYKILFVDDNVNVLTSFKRALHSGNSLWSVFTANSGAEALDLMSQEKIDIIISDLKMPEMDGVELLNNVAAHYPSTLRIAITGDADPVLCQRAAVISHQFIAKPYSSVDLSRLIYQLIGLGNLVLKPEIKQVVLRLSNLPSRPSLYTQLLVELDKSEIDLNHVSEIVSQDIGMAAKILQLVNSAFFGLARNIVEISEAVSYLGVETIRDLAFSVHLFSQFDQEFLDKSGLAGLWNHSLRVATCSRAIYSTVTKEKKSISASFTAGLLHDVGKLIIGMASSGFYLSTALSGVRDPAQILVREQYEFGSTHAEIGAYMLGIWGLPLEIFTAVVNHHDPLKTQKTGVTGLSFPVWFANTYVNGIDNNIDGFKDYKEDFQDKEMVETIEKWRRICSQSIN